MIATPENATRIGDLDHPECVCVGPDGTLYAGGEAGQVYVIPPGGQVRQIASTGGLLLGVALDGNGALHVCDAGRRAVFRVDSDGTVTERSRGTAAYPMTWPNYGVFDAAGNLYVSDSGEYSHPTGTGRVFVIRPDGTTELFHCGPFRFANGLAIDPTQAWLSIAQSTAANVVRIPLAHPNGPMEVTHVLPPYTVPDGLAFTDDGRLLIACYRPDVIYLGQPDGTVEVLVEDPTATLLSRPANVALHAGSLYVANLGGRHLTRMETALRPAPVHWPIF